MAQIDFTNAVVSIAPNSTASPIVQPYLGLATTRIEDVNGTELSQASRVTVSRQERSFIMSYSGSVNAGGTEFYLTFTTQYRWRISNISFSAGDTYVFQIPVTLTCN